MNDGGINFADVYLFLFLGLPLLIGIIGGFWGLGTHGQTRSAWAELPIARPAEQEQPVFHNEIVDRLDENSPQQVADTYQVSTPSAAMERNINELFLALGEDQNGHQALPLRNDDLVQPAHDSALQERFDQAYLEYISEEAGAAFYSEYIGDEIDVQQYNPLTEEINERVQWASTITPMGMENVEAVYLVDDLQWEYEGEGEGEEAHENLFYDSSFSLEDAPSILDPVHYAAIERAYGPVVAQAVTTTPEHGAKELFDVMIGRIKHTHAGFVLTFADSFIPLSGNFPKEDGLTVLVYGQFISYEKFYVAHYEDPANLVHRIPFSNVETTLEAVAASL